MVKKHYLGVAIAILMGLMAWNLWQTREELGQCDALSEQRSGALAITVAPAGCPVNTAGNTTNAQDSSDPSNLALIPVPPVAQVAQESNQAVSTKIPPGMIPVEMLPPGMTPPRMGPSGTIPPSADFEKAIKLMLQEQDRTQPQGSVGMNPFGSPR